MTSGLGHTAHPLQLCPVEIVGSGYLGTTVVYSLLTLLKIVAVVASVGVDGLVVELEDHGTYTVEEESVVGNHKKGLVPSAEISFKPFYHLKVKMVSWLVEDQKVGLGKKHVG